MLKVLKFGGTSMADAAQYRKIADIVQDSAALMASDIAAHPADWHMLQPLWTADKEERRRRKAREATGDEAGES